MASIHKLRNGKHKVSASSRRFGQIAIGHYECEDMAKIIKQVADFLLLDKKINRTIFLEHINYVRRAYGLKNLKRKE